MDRKYYILGALIIALGAYLYFSQMQVSPLGVFTAEGWQKYVEVNLPEGHPEDFYFEMPVQPEMKSDFSDVVVTDGDGRILYLTRSDEVKWSVAGAPVIGSYSVAYPVSLPRLVLSDPWYLGHALPSDLAGRGVRAEFVGSDVSSAELYSYVYSNGWSAVVWSPSGDANVYLAAIGPEGSTAPYTSLPVLANHVFLAYTGPENVSPVQTLRGSYGYNEYPTQQYLSCISSGYCVYMTHFATHSPDHAYVWVLDTSGRVVVGPKDIGVGYAKAVPKVDGSGWWVVIAGDYSARGPTRLLSLAPDGSVSTECTINSDTDYYHTPEIARLGDAYYVFIESDSGYRVLRLTGDPPCSVSVVAEQTWEGLAQGLGKDYVRRLAMVSDGQSVYVYWWARESVEGGVRFTIFRQDVINGGAVVVYSWYVPNASVTSPYVLLTYVPDADGYADAVTVSIAARKQDWDGGKRYAVVDHIGSGVELYAMDSSEYYIYPVAFDDGTMLVKLYGGAFASGHDHGVFFYAPDGSVKTLSTWYVSGSACCGYRNTSAHSPTTIIGRVGDKYVIIAWTWWSGDNTWRIFNVSASDFTPVDFVTGQTVVGSPIMSTDSTVRVFVHVPQDVNRLYVFWGSDQTVQHRSAWSDTQVDVAMSEPRDVEIVPAEINVTSISFDGNKVVASYGIYVDGSLDVNHYYDSPRYYELPLIQNSVESDVEGRQPVDGYSISEDFVQLFGIDPQPLVLVRIEAYGVFRHVDPVTYVLTAQLPDLQPATMSLSATKTQLAGAEEVNVTIDYPAQDAKCYLVDDQNRLVREVNYPTFSILADAGMTINVVCASTDYQPARASLTFTGIPSGPPVGGGGGGGAPPAPATSEPTVQVASATGSTGTPSWVFVAAVVAVIGLFLALSRRH